MSLKKVVKICLHLSLSSCKVQNFFHFDEFLLGLLYKLQKIEDSREGHWYNSPEIFVRNDEDEAEMLNVYGFYWHLIIKVAGVLRSAEADHSPEGQDQKPYTSRRRRVWPCIHP